MAWIRACGGGSPAVPDGRTVTPINDVTIWQQCAGIANPTYTTLAEVLADTGILQTLMASDNAVDYLVRSKQFIGSIALVPAMTSNNTPSGECGSTVPSIVSSAYKSFNRDYGDQAQQTGGASTTMVYYDFGTATKVNKVKSYHSYGTAPTTWSGAVQYSDDGVTFTDAISGLVLQNNTEQTFTFTESSHRYWAFQLTTNPAKTGLGNYQFMYDGICQNSTAMTDIGANNYCANTLLADSDWLDGICNSAYFESVLNVKVPTMTSNNTPSGICSASTENVSAYKAFDGANAGATDAWGNDGDGINQWLMYQFTKNTKVYLAKVTNRNVATVYAIKDFTISGSTDGNTFSTVGSGTVESNTIQHETKVILSSPGDYQYYKLYVNTSYDNTYIRIGELQYYGREDV